MTPKLGMTDSISEQLIEIIHRNATRSFVPLLLSIGLSHLLLADTVAPGELILWSMGTAVVVVARMALLRIISHRQGMKQSTKRRSAALLSFCIGSAFGAVLFFFPESAPFERAMLTAILLGVCSGAVISNSGFRPIFLCYTMPMLIPLGVVWIINPGSDLSDTVAVCVGFSVFLVTLVQAIMAQEVFDAFSRSVALADRLEDQTHELSVALENAENAQNRAEASSESKTRFIAAASHDLRQPVHVLNLFGAALKNADVNPKTREIIDDMNIAVESLSAQLNTLLDISEIDSGTVEPIMEIVDLHELAGTLKQEFQKLAENKNIALVSKVSVGVSVWSDPAMLSRILRNLCSNAIKYTHSGSVTFQAEIEHDEVKICIIDTGIGIEKGDSQKVFEEFYQISNPARDRTRGLGLGLSIVERLVSTLGHTIELNSTPGVGTRIALGVGSRVSNKGKSSMLVNPSPSQDANELPLGFWVHLVDDDQTVRRSMQALLMTLGCKVTSTTSTVETLEFLASRHPSALLVDLRLQDNDSGLDIVDSVTNSHPKLPIALITGETLTDSDIAERYPDLLMLQKPVPMEALLDLLRYMSEQVNADEDVLALE